MNFNPALAALSMPTIQQQKNAMDHSEAMYQRNELFHQEIPLAGVVGCNMKIMGENVAMTYLKQVNYDVAQGCLDLWRNSTKHYENIITDGRHTVSFGFYVDDSLTGGGRIWCTQTFGTFDGNAEVEPHCALFGSTEAPATPPNPTPTLAPTPMSTSTPTPTAISSFIASPTATYTQARADLSVQRGYEFLTKPFGYQEKSYWVLPAGGHIATDITCFNGKTVRIRVKAQGSSTCAKVTFDDKDLGSYKVPSGETVLIYKEIPTCNGAKRLRIDNLGDAKLEIRRAAVAPVPSG